jgi:transcriptional regulator with XRE-family HTH domain
MRKIIVKDMSLTDEDLDRIDQTFRERFSGLMNLCGVSCIEVARSIGVYPSSVQTWAKGKSGKSGALPKIYFMVAIARYFNTTIDYLVGLTDERRPKMTNTAPTDGAAVDLKTCPFCGGMAELIIVPGYFDNGKASGYLVKCTEGCCNQMPYTSEPEAVDAWNWRAEE